MKEIEEKLKAKFDENEIEFRVGATNSDKTMGLAIAYVQARAIQNRLDEVLGFDNWKTSYREVNGGYICSLAIKINNEWVSKEDGASSTEFESVKGGISNSFKRVASSGFGIGRYLYEAESKWYQIKQQGKNFIFITAPTLEEKEITKSVNKTSNKIILDFGKYKGNDLTTIFNNDPKYIDYLLDKCKDKNILNACRILREKGVA